MKNLLRENFSRKLFQIPDLLYILAKEHNMTMTIDHLIIIIP